MIVMSAVPTARVAACTCILLGEDSPAALEASDVAFSGTAVHVDPPVIPGGAPNPGGGPISYLFEVDGVAKGEAGALVTVMSGSGGGDCGMTFTRQERWLIFASRESEESRGRDGEAEPLWTSICAGNLPLEAGEPPPIPVTAPVGTQESNLATAVPAEVLVAVAAAAAIALVSAFLFTRAGRSG